MCAASGCLCHRLISQPSAAPKRSAALRESDRVQGAPPHGAAGVGRRAGAVRLRLPGPHGAAREEGSRNLRVHGIGEQGGAREGDGCRVGRVDEDSTSCEARRGYRVRPGRRGRGRGVEEAGGRLARIYTTPRGWSTSWLWREVESVAYVTRRDVCEFLEEAREPASSRPSKSTSSRTRTRLCSSSSTGPQPAP